MTVLTSLSIALGAAIAMGLKCFAGAFMGYLGLKLANKIGGPIKMLVK